MRKSTSTTISVDRDFGPELRGVAEARGMKVKHIPVLLWLGWQLLTPEQRQAAHDRFEERQKRQLMPVPA